MRFSTSGTFASMNRFFDTIKQQVLGHSNEPVDEVQANLTRKLAELRAQHMREGFQAMRGRRAAQQRSGRCAVRTGRKYRDEFRRRSVSHVRKPVNAAAKTRAELDALLELLERQLPDMLQHSHEDKLLCALAETRSLLETSACAENLGYVRGRIDWILARAGLIADPGPLRRYH